MPGKITWRCGVVDGEHLMRDRSERIEDVGSSRDRRHRDDEDNDRDRHGRHGWRETIRRSLSRGARRDNSRQGQERHRDRSTNRDREDGSRRHAEAHEPVLELAVSAPAPVLVLAPLPVQGSIAIVPAATPGHLENVATPLDPLLGMPLDGLDPVQLRGRSRVRSASPRSTRLRSQAARMPPSTPDLPTSPTSVLPSSHSAKGSDRTSLLLSTASGGTSELLLSRGPASSSGAWHAMELLSAGRLVRFRRARSCSPARPPGFEFPCDPRTPPFVSASPVERTPSPRAVEVTAPTQPAAHLEPLFSHPQEPLLSPPMSSPPQRPVDRRKTLVG